MRKDWRVIIAITGIDPFDAETAGTLASWIESYGMKGVVAALVGRGADDMRAEFTFCLASPDEWNAVSTSLSIFRAGLADVGWTEKVSLAAVEVETCSSVLTVDTDRGTE